MRILIVFLLVLKSMTISAQAISDSARLQQVYAIGLQHNTVSPNLKSVDEFKQTFGKIAKCDVSKNSLYQLYLDYPFILSPYNASLETFEALYWNGYSMLNFKKEKLYKNNILKLLKSKNVNNRTLAYTLIAATNDNTKDSYLQAQLSTETDTMALHWVAQALLSTKTKNTDLLFDFLVKFENFEDAHLLPSYFLLDTALLKKTALHKINNEAIKSKILAVQLLAIVPNDKQVEQAVINTIASLPIEYKGYAINALTRLQIANVYTIVKDYLKNEYTQKIALEALQNSPTAEDRAIYEQLKVSQ